MDDMKLSLKLGSWKTFRNLRPKLAGRKTFGKLGVGNTFWNLCSKLRLWKEFRKLGLNLELGNVLGISELGNILGLIPYFKMLCKV